MAVTLPPAPSKVTFTGAIGPGNSVTSMALTNVRQVNFQFDRGICEVQYYGAAQATALPIDGISTVTVTIAADVATFTMS